MYKHWISIDQAKFYTKYSNAFWKKLIKREIIPTSPALPIERIKEIDDSFFQVVKIPLNVLPKYAQESFLIDNLIKNHFFDMDFIGYKSIAIKSDYRKLLNEIELIKRINRIRLQHRDHSFDMVKEALRRENIPLSTYYNKEQKYMSTPIKLLIDRPKYYRSTCLCPLSEQYILYYYCLETALGLISKMAQYHKMCRIIGYPGSGKTKLLKEYLKRDENAVMLTPGRNCTEKDLLKSLGAAVNYYCGNKSKFQATRELIAFLNARGKDTVFLIDEADSLCSHESHTVKNIDRLENIRYIWDNTRLHTSFIFAAPFELEARLQRSSDTVITSQFYRRCTIHILTGITEKSGRELLDKIEEFHVKFDSVAKTLMIRRMLEQERGGLGIELETLEKAMMLTCPEWDGYYKSIEYSMPREKALELFKDAPQRTISQS